jgi:hypothetical protein
VINLYLSLIAEIDFLGGATECAFGNRIEQEFALLVELDGDHVYIEDIQAV